MKKLIVAAVLAAMMSGPVVADVKSDCWNDWKGDIHSYRVCVENGGNDVFAKNTFRYKYRHYKKHVTAMPATRADAPIVQADQPTMPVALGVWTWLLVFGI